MNIYVVYYSHDYGDFNSSFIIETDENIVKVNHYTFKVGSSIFVLGEDSKIIDIKYLTTIK